jgi:tetratricopeptide (TPR) repeat protein
MMNADYSRNRHRPAKLITAARTRLVLAALLLLNGSCSQLGLDKPAVSSTDPAKARLTLRDIPPAVSLPPESAPTSQPVPSPAAERQFKKGQERFEEGLWAEAAEALQRALEMEPNLTEARILLARANAQQGNADLAVEHLQRALQQRPRSAVVHQLLGELAWQAGDSAKALVHLRQALLASADRPKSPERVMAHLTLALLLKKEGYLRAAAEEWDQYLAAAENPTDEMKSHAELRDLLVLYRGKAAGILGEIYTELGDHTAACKAYEKAVTQNPKEPSLKADLILANARAGNADRAFALLHETMGDDAAQSKSLTLLKQVCDLLGTPKRYEVELARLAKQIKNPALQLELAEVLLKRGMSDQAIEVLEVLVKKSPGDSTAKYLLANIYADRNESTRCLQILASALKRSPTTLKRTEETLLRGAKSDRLGAWLDSAKTLADAATDEPAPRFLYAMLLAQSGKNADATRELQAIRKKEGRFGPAVVLLTRLLVEARAWDGAMAAADEAIEAGVHDSDIYLMKGRAADAVNEFRAAEAAYLEAFRQDSKSSLAIFSLAELAERRGDRRRCEQLFKRIVDDVDPRYIPAREKLVRLYLNTDRLDAAKKCFAGFERLDLTGSAVDRCRALLEFAESAETPGPKRLEAYRLNLRKIIADHPDDSTTYIDLAMSCLADREYAMALKELDAAAKLDANSLRIGELKATIQGKLLDFEAACATVRGLLRERPRDASYHQKLAELSMARIDFDTAAKSYEALIARDDLKEARPQLYGRLIEVLTLAKKYDKAVEAAKRAMDDSPSDERRRQTLLGVLNLAKRDDEAVTAASKWLAADPTSADLRTQYIEQLVLAKRYTEATRKVLDWMEGDPDDLDLNVLLIRIFWAKKDWTSAIEHIKTGAEMTEHRGQFENWLAMTNLRAAKYDDAINYHRARAQSGGSEAAYRDLINVLIEAKRYAEAEKTVYNILQPQLDRRSAGERYEPGIIVAMRGYLSLIYQSSDRQRKSDEQLEAIYEMTPNDPEINNNLAYSWIEAGLNLDRAEKMVRLAVEERPTTSAYLDSLGWLLYKRGQYDQALVYLRRAVALSVEGDPILFSHLGDALYRAGKPNDAKAAWEKSLALSKEKADDSPSPEEVRTRARVEQELKSLAEKKPVEVAPIGETGKTDPPAVTSQPSR